MTYVLIILFYTGMLSNNDSLSVGSVSGFISQQECIDAGSALRPLVSGTVKEVRFTCVRQGVGQ